MNENIKILMWFVIMCIIIGIDEQPNKNKK